MKNMANCTPISPVVVKFGGSLMDEAVRIAPILRAVRRPLLIVPGGGPFAERVRELAVDGDTAHWMAICGMEQYGLYLASVGTIATRNDIAVSETPAVLLPYAALRAEDPLPHSWTVTSDTIAAWVASRLRCAIVLLKSVDGIRVDGKIQKEIAFPVVCDEVDPLFIPFVLGHGLTAYVVNGRNPRVISALAEGNAPEGTVIRHTINAPDADL
jgi:hypothetical protein